MAHVLGEEPEVSERNESMQKELRTFLDTVNKRKWEELAPNEKEEFIKGIAVSQNWWDNQWHRAEIKVKVKEQDRVMVWIEYDSDSVRTTGRAYITADGELIQFDTQKTSIGWFAQLCSCFY